MMGWRVFDGKEEVRFFVRICVVGLEGSVADVEVEVEVVVTGSSGGTGVTMAVVTMWTALVLGS